MGIKNTIGGEIVMNEMKSDKLSASYFWEIIQKQEIALEELERKIKSIKITIEEAYHCTSNFIAAGDTLGDSYKDFAISKYGKHYQKKEESLRSLGEMIKGNQGQLILVAQEKECRLFYNGDKRNDIALCNKFIIGRLLGDSLGFDLVKGKLFLPVDKRSVFFGNNRFSFHEFGMPDEFQDDFGLMSNSLQVGVIVGDELVIEHLYRFHKNTADLCRVSVYLGKSINSFALLAGYFQNTQADLQKGYLNLLNKKIYLKNELKITEQNQKVEKKLAKVLVTIDRLIKEANSLGIDIQAISLENNK